MDIHQLECFKTVVEEGSILRASIKLNISQPPLSRMMSQLEEELKTTLFLRGKSITLTNTGKLLYERACSILDLKNNTLKEISTLEMKNEITLNIGIVSSSTNLLYNHTIPHFHTNYPKVRFNIQEANTYQLIELLNQKLIDLAIVRTPFDATNFIVEYFHKEPMIAISKEQFGDSKINLKNLDGKPLIIYRRFKELLIQLFKQAQLEFNTIAEVDDAKTAILLASTGLGITLVPQSAYRTFEHLNLNVAEITKKELETCLGVIQRKGDKLNATYTAFIESIGKEK
ncbi:MAG: LysR family transcriptional regulator [Anaeroplasmataceae bacterium]|nr:LysR family transcriptional regulator [Anaeroplasmataceae bacterium]